MPEKIPNPGDRYRFFMDGGSRLARAVALVLAMAASGGAEAYKIGGDVNSSPARELTQQGLRGGDEGKMTQQQYRQAVDYCQVNPTASGCAEVLQYEQSVNGGLGGSETQDRSSYRKR